MPQEDWRRTAAERIEAGAQATVEDRFVPSGEIVLLAGNVKIASVYIFAKIDSGDPEGAAAISVVLLLISVGILLLMGRFAKRGLPI